jgi:AraC-like DNA-binding protein
MKHDIVSLNGIGEKDDNSYVLGFRSTTVLRPQTQTYEIKREVGQSPTSFRADEGYNRKECLECDNNKYRR